VSCRLLILLPERLNERLSVRVEEFLTPLLPRRSKFRCRNIPVRPAILQPGPQVPAEVLHRGTTEKLVAVVDLINNKAGLKHNHVRNHRVVNRIGVLGYVEILLHGTPPNRKEEASGHLLRRDIHSSRKCYRC
jgi:hypothetical protein